MRRLLDFRAAGALAFVLSLAACGQDAGSPTDATPTPKPLPLVAALKCQAVVATRTVTCSRGDATDASRTLIVGGQGTYVQLTSSNVSYVGTLFSFDVTVKNLLPSPQMMGTADGVTADPNGVQVFFNMEPTVVVGTGNISIANADGTGTFLAAGQPYYQYPTGILANSQTTSAKNWQFNIDNTVTSFAFKVYVATEVRYPNGWIDITPATPYLLAGAGQALTGTVHTVVGNVVADPITWGTSDGTVATVDGSGNVSAVAPGSVNITATAGTRSALTAISVCPNLAVGEVYTAVMPGASSTCFGGGTGAKEFTYMPINLSTSSSLSSFSVTASGIQAVTGPPTPARLPLGGLQPGRDVTAQAELHMQMLERMRRETNPLMANRSSRIRRGTASTGGARRIITQGVVPVVGDSMDLNTNSSCSGSPSVRRGVVRSVSNHLIILGDTANPAGGFTTAQYDSIALEFDTIAWPVDSANFGAPTDEDGNGHVVAFFTRAVNELSPPASSSVVLGYFASKDVFSNDPVSGCSNSNMGEMFYMLVPDPTGAVNSNVRTVSFVRGNTTGTLGHEFQHMINAWRRAYVTGASSFEQGYLNEGLSHIAEELMFYRASGMSPRVNIQSGTNATSGIQLNSRRVAAYNAYQSQNFGRLRSWLQRPDTAGAFKPNQNSLAVRGAIWSFLRYAGDRFIPVNPQQSFWYSLVNSNLEGKANIQNAIGGADADAWLRDFTTAIYADDNAFAVATQYQNPSWNYRSMYTILYGSYQVQVRPLTNATPLTLTYSSGGGTAFTRFGVAASSFARVTGFGAGNTIPATPFALAVVRTK